MNRLSILLPFHVLALAAASSGCEIARQPSATPTPARTHSTAHGETAQAPGSEAAAFLEVHNNARNAVGVLPLEWSAELTADSQKRAEQLLATGGDLVHRTNSPYGENLAGGRGGNRATLPKLAAELWLRERALYKGGPAGSQDDVGHYTAMVWRTTTQVAYGPAVGADGSWVLVAGYSPPGNIVGRHPYK